MPTVTVYYQKTKDFKNLQALVPHMKKYFAKTLTCGDIRLTPNEISIRCVETKGQGMIGDVEVEIKAHAFMERVKKQDKLCRDAAAFIEKEIPSLRSVKVWLQLSELGHSW